MISGDRDVSPRGPHGPHWGEGAVALGTCPSQTETGWGSPSCLQARPLSAGRVWGSEASRFPWVLRTLGTAQLGGSPVGGVPGHWHSLSWRF